MQNISETFILYILHVIFNGMIRLMRRAMLPSCGTTSSPIPVVPLVEPPKQFSTVRPGQEDKVLESEVNDESFGMSAAASATAAVLSTR